MWAYNITNCVYVYYDNLRTQFFFNETNWLLKYDVM